MTLSDVVGSKQCVYPEFPLILYSLGFQNPNLTRYHQIAINVF